MWLKLWQVGLHYLLPYIKTADDLDEQDLDEREVMEVENGENATLLPCEYIQSLVVLMANLGGFPDWGHPDKSQCNIVHSKIKSFASNSLQFRSLSQRLKWIR